MVDYRDSAILRMLVLEKLRTGSGATETGHGIGAGLPGGDKTDPLAARPGEGREPMGMGKDGARSPAKFTGGGHARSGRSRSPIRLVHVSQTMSGMPMRKRAARTPFLICIEGGKR